jgi:hypothetical protein
MANHVIVITQLVIAKMDPLSLIVQVFNNNYIHFIIETILYMSILSKLADPCVLDCNGQPCNSDNTACDCQNGSSQSDCSGILKSRIFLNLNLLR